MDAEQMDIIILVVDDEPANLTILTRIFRPLYQVRVCKSGEDALLLLNSGLMPDLIILDILMPGLGGYETLSRIRGNHQYDNVPVIFVSSLDSDIDEDRGFSLGAVDYITKPFKPSIVLARAKVHLELKHIRDNLQDSNRWLEAEVQRRIQENQLIQDASLTALAQLAEARDNTTGHHIERACRYVEVLARDLQKTQKYSFVLKDSYLNMLVKAALLHDIGKIGIPDSILLKPGRLTAEEHDVIKTHCQIGAEALQRAINKTIPSSGESHAAAANSLMFLELAKELIECHHEHWDGTGYPAGLHGEEIPVSARLMALADVFDALTTSRPYKKAWSIEESAKIIIDQKGYQFDPDVVDAFIRESDSFKKILAEWGDSE